MTNILLVGLGGGIGAVMRYAISQLPYHGTFPLLTFITNLLGAILIGYIVASAAPKQLSTETVNFLKTGLCGGFTTFSTFSLEVYTLAAAAKYFQAGLYALLSVIFCLVGIMLGIYLAKQLK